MILYDAFCSACQKVTIHELGVCQDCGQGSGRAGQVRQTESGAPEEPHTRGSHTGSRRQESSPGQHSSMYVESRGVGTLPVSDKRSGGSHGSLATMLPLPPSASQGNSSVNTARASLRVTGRKSERQAGPHDGEPKADLATGQRGAAVLETRARESVLGFKHDLSAVPLTCHVQADRATSPRALADGVGGKLPPSRSRMAAGSQLGAGSNEKGVTT